MQGHKLFVYGSLRSDLTPAQKGKNSLGQQMRQLLRVQASLLGPASIQGQLYAITARYPGALASPRPEQRVQGELYQLGDKLLATLDAYEGCSPEDARPWEFRRELTEVIRSDGSTLQAWVYYYNLDIQNQPFIASGDYRDFA